MRARHYLSDLAAYIDTAYPKLVGIRIAFYRLHMTYNNALYIVARLYDLLYLEPDGKKLVRELFGRNIAYIDVFPEPAYR